MLAERRSPRAAAVCPRSVTQQSRRIFSFRLRFAVTRTQQRAHLQVQATTMAHQFSDLERDILLKTWREMAPLQHSTAERILRLICRYGGGWYPLSSCRLCRTCPELRPLFGDDDDDANANKKPTTKVQQSGMKQSVKCLQPIVQQAIAVRHIQHACLLERCCRKSAK